MEYPKDEPATAMGFKKIAKSEVINMVGRTSNISRTASVNVIVKERQDMTISTDDVLCNTDTARVGINTGYEVLNWYNVTNPEAEIMVENIQGPILLLSGGRDVIAPSKWICRQIMNRLHKNNFAYAYSHHNEDCQG